MNIHRWILAVVAANSFISLTAVSDELDDMLDIEKQAPEAEIKEEPATDKQSPPAKKVEPEKAPKPRRQVAKPEPVPVPNRVADNVDKTPPALVKALEEKTLELNRARKRIAELEGWIVKIKEANRREKATFCYNMGCVYKTSRHFKRAEEQFLKALEMMPRDPDIHYNLAILYDDDLEDIEKAEKHYRKFLELSPDDEDAAAVIEWLGSLTKKPKKTL